MFTKDTFTNTIGIINILINKIILINIILLSILRKTQYVLILALIRNPNCSRQFSFASNIS